VDASRDGLDAAAAEARDGATPDEKREDARAAHQLASLGRAQQRRAQQALAEVDSLAQFRPAPLPGNASISVGAIVEVEDEESGEGRTFFLAPVGAGITLTGPGGDGHLSVVTPASPIGRAVLGKKTGDIVDITVDGDVREWSISPIFGMPILNADQSKAIIVLKRSQNPGFAGIENELFVQSNTMMVLGDAKQTLGKLSAAVKGAHN